MAMRRRDTPFPLYEVELEGRSGEELLEISREMGLGLSLEEMKAIQNHFSRLGRNPTDIELETLGQTWSEHCYHKTFKGLIEMDGERIESLLKTYIVKATDEIGAEWCFSTFEDNAGIIDFEGDYAIAAKVETHNHPSAIDPFGGAATGIGGVIRDILGVWGEPIANTDVLCFGPLDLDPSKLPRGVKHPRYLFKGVVAGIGAYGNNMGIPTVNGAIYFDEGYTGNVVVYCGCIGLLPKSRYARRVKPGHLIVLAGGRTGRDGIHGVTFASAELTEESGEVSRPAVQIPNPIEEEVLKRAILEIRDRGLASGITDLGGGGLSSAVGETAHRYGCGAEVELDRVPLKDPYMAPWEIWISESQERMLLAIPEENREEVLGIFEGEGVEATVIGRFTPDPYLKITYKGVTIADISIDFLFQPPRVRRKASWRKPLLKEPSIPLPKDLGEVLLKLLSSPNIASREGVIRTYDHEVKGNTVLKPLQGEYAGPNDASVIKPLPHSWKGLAISNGLKPSYSRVDPYWMAASAIDEAIRNNVAVGGRRIALLDNFTWGNPEREDRLGALVRACQACYDYAKAYGPPFISGKDSLYNESTLGPVLPTLLITALGIIPDIRKTVSMEVKEPGNPIYIVGTTYPELGGSEYYRLHGLIGGSVPRVRAETAKKIYREVIRAVDEGLVRACHDVSDGGLAVALAEMAFTGGYGLEIHLNKVPMDGVEREDTALFSESNSRLILEVPGDHVEEFEECLKGVPYSPMGRVTEEKVLRIYGFKETPILEIPIDLLREAWRRGLEG